MKIHHIGYLVENMTAAIRTFEELSYAKTADGIIYDPARDVALCFLKNGEYQIELVSPKSKNCVIYNILKKVGNSPYHICYEVGDLDGKVKELRSKGYLPIQMPQAAVGIENRRVAFLVNKDIGMIELVEE